MNSVCPPPAPDLSSCDIEPIHILAAIQSHGALLVLREADLVVMQASANVGELLGAPFEQILHRSLSSTMGHAAHELVRSTIEEGAGRWETLNPVHLQVGDRSLDGIIHRHDGVLILELESPSSAASSEELSEFLRCTLISLQAARTLDVLCKTVVTAVRRLTGFDRVVAYRFHPTGDGSVVAESKQESLDSYVGLHYPASDIPRQARELYRKNWLRIIPDARYVSVPIIPSQRGDTGGPLDLSFSVLRSVSPIHLEYMANQGARASMSISLVVGDQLWGLISCTSHSGPHRVAYRLRSTCEMVGRVTSLQVAAVEAHQLEATRTTRHESRRALSRALRAGTILQGLAAEPDHLLKLVQAQGAAVVTGAEVTRCGVTPAPSVITALAEWLDAQSQPDTFASSCLSSVYPPAQTCSDCASGVLTIFLPGLPRRRLIWFRPEILESVDWGGDPHKPICVDANVRLHPRLSFAVWRQEVKSHSALWTDSDLEAAAALRQDAVEIDLERQVSVARKAIQARDDMVAVVSHDLRSPLGVISMHAAILMQSAGGGQGRWPAQVLNSAEHIQRSAGRMDILIRDLLDLAKLEAGHFTLDLVKHRMSELIEQSLLIFQPLADAKSVKVALTLDDHVVVVDRNRLFQVLANLLGNAIKFTPRRGQISITCESDDQWTRVTISDSGPGVAPDQLKNVFDRYWQAEGSQHQGSGLGLFIAKGIVDAHGGQIWAEHRPGEGATFVFSLPLVRQQATYCVPQEAPCDG